ncbi:DNA-directed DNA polymerase IV [Aspergillus mulundensis]|uniref:DNA polymerase n=1 Tax=Aspergillus mulundensis TaxID=1810919 RepID=A0A3D8RR30_9EURO|nr:Uncharacterized protein DSM5745_06400 [Aspergillus mulundensis]RDW76408.1 Uncharacterized protein DSM5745_06400 [Aspergillus mulundensis]
MTTDKEAFFMRLEQLDCPSDESEGEFDRLIATSRRNGGIHSSPDSFYPRSPSYKSSFLEDVPVAAGRLSPVSSITSITEITGNELNVQSDMGSSKRPAKYASGKRKRGVLAAKIIPEQQQILKGLVFFFFPNNDVSPLRRVRIQRAQEYGALWAKTWRDDITHIIVDKGLKYDDILKHLKMETVPPEIAVVNESYPADCIKWRSIPKVTQFRFQVKGAPSSEPSVPSNPPEELPAVTDGSLPLKPEGKQLPQTQRSSQLLEQEEPTPEPAPVLDLPDEANKQMVPDSFAERERDALDLVIEETKATEHLPLDPSDDDAPAGDSDNETDNSQPPPAKSKRRKLSRDENEARGSWQKSFRCMQKHDLTSKSVTQNPNAKTIEVLQNMLEYYTRTADQWRTLAYRKAISALRSQPKKVTNRADAIQIPGIGERLADKIEEIVLTNRLRRLENTSNTAEDRLLQTFLGVYGAGLAVASRWIAQGYKSLDDLRTRATLTQSQRIGLEHYFDFSQRIPRSEVQEHGDYVRRVVQKESPEMEVIIGGSYRRGAADCGDIDLLITRSDATIDEIRTMMLDIVVPKLFEEGFLQTGLATTSREDGSKWHGASKLPGGQFWRRIDLLFVPGSELGAALVYFTGNDIFNRSIRLLASKKGMRLNQKGLYADVVRGPQRAKLNTGRLIESRSEERIFELLGVPWRPPEHRIC